MTNSASTALQTLGSQQKLTIVASDPIKINKLERDRLGRAKTVQAIIHQTFAYKTPTGELVASSSFVEAAGGPTGVMREDINSQIPTLQIKTPADVIKATSEPMEALTKAVRRALKQVEETDRVAAYEAKIRDEAAQKARNEERARIKEEQTAAAKRERELKEAVAAAEQRAAELAKREKERVGKAVEEQLAAASKMAAGGVTHHKSGVTTNGKAGRKIPV